MYAVNPNKVLNRIENISVSKNYIVTCSGSKVKIYNKKFDLIYTVDKLKYVYNAYLSPDEKYLLMISNGNQFLVFSLVDLKIIRKYNLEDRLDYPIDGKGSWNFNSNEFVILATDKVTLYPCLLWFSLTTATPYKKVDLEGYYVTQFKSLEHIDKFLLAGVNNKDNHKNYFIFIDEKSFRECVIEDFDDNIIEIQYNNIYEKYFVYGNNESGIYSDTGSLIGFSKCKEIILNNSNNNEWLKSIDLSPIEKTQIFNEFIDFRDNEIINKVAKFNNILFLATNLRFIIFSIDEKVILSSKNFDFGVNDFYLLNENNILLHLWNGFKIYNTEKTGDGSGRQSGDGSMIDN